MRDNINDMITRIRNGQKTRLEEVILYWPTSKICLKILNSLYKEGFIRGYKKVIDKNKVCISVLLKYTESQTPVIKNISRISKIGQRIFIKSTGLWKGNVGKGVYILSTPKGILTDNEARALNLGGEILLYVE